MNKKTYIGINLTEEEYAEIKKIQEDYKKKGLRITMQKILEDAFKNGLEEAEKELEKIKKNKPCKPKKKKA